MIISSLVFLAISFVDWNGVTRILEQMEILATLKRILGSAAYEDNTLEWRVEEARNEVGGDGDSSCALTPTGQMRIT